MNLGLQKGGSFWLNELSLLYLPKDSRFYLHNGLWAFFLSTFSKKQSPGSELKKGPAGKGELAADGGVGGGHLCFSYDDKTLESQAK